MTERFPQPVNADEQQRLLTAVDTLFQELQGSRLNADTLAANQASANVLAQFLGTTPRQAALFAVLTGLALQDTPADWSHLATYFDCTPIQVLALRADLETLIQLGIVVASHQPMVRVQGVEVYESQTFVLRRSWYDALTGVQPSGRSMPGVVGNPSRLLQLLDALAGILNDYAYEELPMQRLWGMLQPHFERLGPDVLPALQADPSPDPTDVLVLLLLAYKHSQFEDGADLGEIGALMFHTVSERTALRLRFVRGESVLQRHGWVVMRPSEQTQQLRLTERGLREAFEPSAAAELSALRREPALLDPKGISCRDLLYNPRELADIETLDRLLAPATHRQLMQRFAALELGRGLTVLLHGRPGTGKTETVYQLCRKHGRHLHRVDISGVRSMWYGESEKNLRRIFEQYRRWFEELDVAPVLMFNEADALFGQRLLTHSSADQTHNSLQSILLDEMERFEGILFITTNLVRQIDLAFDRRFLFKIRLDPPVESIRERIWVQRLPQLTASQSAELARRFALSGGQIDNVVRRYRLLATLREEPVRFEELLALCRSEGIAPQSSGLGFQSEVGAELRGSTVEENG
jgi:hypothetical protein